MQNVKKDKPNHVSGILEEIVRCVTAPSFCVMPWKCVTMAVGDRTDPLVKKSVVHIYRTSKDGQNIFQIKVHNCKKEVCDHTICTKDCESIRQTNYLSRKEANQSEINKRKRKKKNKNPEGNKDTALGCCMVNVDDYENSFQETKSSKYRITSTQKNKKKAENKEKPSCTLQIFTDGKCRKLNFQLHPAMKIFLSKALDRIEGHDSKARKMPSAPYTISDVYEDQGKTSPMPRSSITNSPDICCGVNKDAESVEEFEINLPENTNNGKFYKDESCERYYYYDNNDMAENQTYKRISSDLKINAGYLLENIVPVQEFLNGKGNCEKENSPRNESQLGATPEKFHDDLLTTDSKRRITEPVTEPPPNERGINYKIKDEGLVPSEERFHSQNLRQPTFIYGNAGMNSEGTHNLTESSRNLSSGNGLNPQYYLNHLQYFQNRPGDNITRSPGIVEHNSDNNELLVNDMRNNRNRSIPDNRAPRNSSDFINNPMKYRSNTRIYSPPIVNETYSMSHDNGTFLSNDGVCRNRLYESRQYHNFPNNGNDFINMRVAPEHYKIPYNRHETMLPKENIDHETQTSHENRIECGRFKCYHFLNDRDTNLYPEPENRTYQRETSESVPYRYFSSIPTKDRSRGYLKDGTTSITNCYQSFSKDQQERSVMECQRYVRSKCRGNKVDSRMNHRSNEPTRRKNYKYEGKSQFNNDKRRSENTKAQQVCSLQNCSETSQSKASANNPIIAKTIDYNSSTSSVQNETNQVTRGSKNNRKEKRIHHRAEPYKKVIDKSRIQYENEEEVIKNRQKKKNRKLKNEDNQIPESNVVYHRKPSKEIYALDERDQSAETTVSTNCCTQDFYPRDPSEKSSDKLSFRYHMPGDYSSYQFIRSHGNRQVMECISPEIINESNEGLYSNDYDADSKFFCYPSQISWDHNTELNNVIPNLNQSSLIKDQDTEEKVEPKSNIETEGESSKLCLACCKALNDDKTIGKSLGDYYIKTYEKSNSCTKNIVMNNSQYKSTTSSGEPYCIKNDLVPNKDTRSCNSTNLNFNDVLGPINYPFTSADILNPMNYPLANTVVETKQFNPDNCARKIDEKNSIVDSPSLKDNNATINCENVQKKSSKILNSQSVKKIFSHAKEYLGIRKYSTSSIKSDQKTRAVQVGPLNTTSAPAAMLNVEENPTSSPIKIVETSDYTKNDGDVRNVNRKECSNGESKLLTVNDKDVPLSSNIECKVTSSYKPMDVSRNNPKSLKDPSAIKIGTYTSSQANLNDEKYRLYGSNEVTMDRSMTELSNAKSIKNEYKILQSESECEGFSDDIYRYSSSEWQSEVAKNWIAPTKKSNHKPDERIKVSSQKEKYESVESLCPYFSYYKTEKEEKRLSNRNKPMINATIALNPEQEKRDKHEVHDQVYISQFSKQKSDHRISNLVPSSIKNNYKKIKGLVKKKQKSPTKLKVLKKPSVSDTRSLSLLTPVTSTSMAADSGGTVFTQNTVVEIDCNETTIKKFTQDSNYVNSDPIIRRIEPTTWQKFVSKRLSLQARGRRETLNEITDDSSMSDVTIDRPLSRVSSIKNVLESINRNRALRSNQRPAKNFVRGSGPLEQNRQSKIYHSDRSVFSESMHIQNTESNDSTTNESTCFQNPMVDPKTGFRPFLPI